MIRLFYHPESDAIFLAEPGPWQEQADGALCVDVSDDMRFRSRAVLEDIDLDEITNPEDLIDPLTKDTAEAAKILGVSGAIVEAMRKWSRKPADLYPTPEDCTYSLLPYIAPLLPPNAYVLEPACADGQMVRPLREFGYNVTGYDLRPDVLGGEGGVDFLDAKKFPKPIVPFDAVITNPPFSAAEEFIYRALEIAPVAVMLLKAQYWNTKGRRRLFRKTRPLMELNLTWRPAFLADERGKSPLMDCMWIVWQRGHTGSCTTEPIDRVFDCPPNMDFGGL